MPDDKVFLDSNVLIYIYSFDEPDKRAVAISLCDHNAVISFQVLNEISNVLTGKFSLEPK
jgi:predicted nucleic acid-binding protein